MAAQGCEALLTARPCTVLIARPEAMAALDPAARLDSAELVAVTDAEPLRALDVITTRIPTLVTIDRVFAATPRGSALISRLKADPALAKTEIRVAGVEDAPAPPPALEPERAGVSLNEPLDRRGTRRAQRFPIAGDLAVLVDGNPASLVDVSTIGAQVLSPTVLRPNQRVRVSLPNDQGAIRCAAIVAWASFEIPQQSNPRYRAGLEFFNPDTAAIDAFCARHRSA